MSRQKTQQSGHRRSSRTLVWYWVGLCVLVCGLWHCGGGDNKERTREEPTREEPTREGVPDAGRTEQTKELVPEPRTEARPEAQQDAAAEATPEQQPEQPPRDEDGNELRCNSPFQWPVKKRAITITPSANWRNQATVGQDSFAGVSGAAHVFWIKFTILLADPDKVYFQNGQRYKFHYDFATKELDPFKGMSRAAYNKISLHKAGQQVVLGAVVFTERRDQQGYGIVLEGHDPMHPTLVAALYKSVQRSLKAPKDSPSWYFPSFHQADSANKLKSCLQGKGVEVSAVDRWITSDQCYAGGWAVGRLRQFAGKEIEKAYKDGRLKPTDILLTDSVPSEIPHVAGVLSLRPTTPNSHVVILANTFRVPFAYIKQGQEQAKTLVDKDIVIRVEQGGGFHCKVTLFALDASVTKAERQALLDQKKPPKVEFSAKTKLGKLHTTTEGRRPSDSKTIGGKAANFGLLRAALPNNSPRSIALSFDLWDQYMAQSLKSGQSLAQYITAKLKGFRYPPDMAKLDKALKEIRDTIKDEADFNDTQRQTIIKALKPFDPNKKIRFRSSTNVEDSKVFTGAGLYDSYSGCLADDQDKDKAGPSLCDSSKTKERGVFRALRKVYASFYNNNAYLERLRFGIDESKVGMAVLVHHSFPDENELANGVATIIVESNRVQIKLVTQKGAVSITNPKTQAQPEVVEATKYDFQPQFRPRLKQSSSLVPLGDTVLTLPQEYLALLQLLQQVYKEGEKRGDFKQPYMLDLEYKKMKPGTLIIKQVRQVPFVDQKSKLTPFLLNRPQQLCVFQGEYSDVFAIHRLKSRWMLQTKSLLLTDKARQQSLLAQSSFRYLEGEQRKTFSGLPSTWPQAKHSHKRDAYEDRHRDSFMLGARLLTLESSYPNHRSPRQTALVTVGDLLLYLSATYAKPVPYFDHNQKLSTRSKDIVRLSTVCPATTKLNASHTKKSRSFQLGALKIDTSYYWPSPPTGITAGYTAPLIKWDKTTIRGLLTQTIVLTDAWAQSHRPDHHNFGASFIFEPRLDPKLTTQQRQELKAKNIRWIYLRTGTKQAWVMGFDGKLRVWK